MDKREAILARILVILQGIPLQVGYVQHSVFRNRGELPEGKRPAIVLLDGVEEAVTPMTTKGHTRFMAPAVIRMLPQIFVLLKPRMLPDNAGVGEEINTFRAAVIKAMNDDATLIQLCGSNGQLALQRFETDMQTGSTLQGEMRFDFAIDYVLDPNAL